MITKTSNNNKKFIDNIDEIIQVHLICENLKGINGGVSEWFIETVLKTVERDERSESSNLSPSAKLNWL